MTNSPDDELDRRIRTLMGAAGDEGPTAPSTTPTARVGPPVSPPHDRRWWLAVATVAVLVIGGAAFGFGHRRAAKSITPATEPTAPLVTDPDTTVAATSTPVSTASGPTVRPFLDPAICSSGTSREFVSNDITYHPFAFDLDGPIPLQVLASPVDGVVKPFAVVVRAPANRHPVNGHDVTVNGLSVSIAVTATGNNAGNGEAQWTLSDGSSGYLRSRDLDEQAIAALIGRLTPRPPSAPIPGFDLAPTTDPDGLVLLHEHLNSGVSGRVEMYECTGRNGHTYRVRAIAGDPLFVYFGIVDVRRPYAVGANGTGVITLEGTAGPGAPTIDQVVNADQNSWDHLGQAARTCSGSDLEANASVAGVAMSNVKYVIRLTNISDTSCSMPAGALRLSAVADSNNVVPVAAGPGTYFGDPPPLVGPLDPQGTAAVWVSVVTCDGTPTTWPGYDLELPDHSRVRFTSNIDTHCAIGISTIGI